MHCSVCRCLQQILCCTFRYVCLTRSFITKETSYKSHAWAPQRRQVPRITCARHACRRSTHLWRCRGMPSHAKATCSNGSGTPSYLNMPRTHLLQSHRPSPFSLRCFKLQGYTRLRAYRRGHPRHQEMF